MLSPIPDQTCLVCLWWKRLTGATGECRRYAPRPTHEESAFGLAATWPRTFAEDWCGEYQPPPVKQTIVSLPVATEVNNHASP